VPELRSQRKISACLRWFAIGAVIGFVVGCGAAFIYFNVDPLERTAAAADGFSRWSPWGLFFTLPWGFIGAVGGIVGALVAQGFVAGCGTRTRRRLANTKLARLGNVDRG